MDKIIQSKTLKNNQNRADEQIPHHEDKLVYVGWIFMHNWRPYSIEDAIEKFGDWVHRILKRSSSLYLINKRKWV